MLAQGQLEAQRVHEELLARRGRNTELIQLQPAAYL